VTLCWEPLKTLPGFLERTKNEKRRFRFSSKLKPCGFDFGWHIHVPMVSSKNQRFLEVPYVPYKIEAHDSCLSTALRAA
jgi:hypothetical protein